MVDDGSTDFGPIQLRRLVAGDTRFILTENTFSKSKGGPASARNCALSLVKTKYIAFCDIDDIWHPQKLKSQLQFHLDNDLDLSVTAYCEFEDMTVKPPVIIPPSRLTYSRLLMRNSIPMLTAIVSTSIASINFKEVPHEDYLFWLQTFFGNPTIKYGCLPHVLAYYRQHDNNLSKHKATIYTWSYQVYRAAGFSTTKSVSMVIRWIICHIANYICKHHSYRLINPTPLAKLLSIPPLMPSSRELPDHP